MYLNWIEILIYICVVGFAAHYNFKRGSQFGRDQMLAALHSTNVLEVTAQKISPGTKIFDRLTKTLHDK